MKLAAALTAAMLAAAPAAAQGPTIKDAAFLAGHWRGEQGGMMFEEVWLAPEGDVMTGMARGVNKGALAVLEYIIIADTHVGTYMSFEHFNPDYTTWEADAGAIRLRFTEAKQGDVLFESEDPDSEVQSVRYFLTGADSMQADVVLLEDGERGGFSLSFERID